MQIIVNFLIIQDDSVIFELNFVFTPTAYEIRTDSILSSFIIRIMFAKP